MSASASRLEKELAGKSEELKTANNQLHVCDFCLSVLRDDSLSVLLHLFVGSLYTVA